MNTLEIVTAVVESNLAYSWSGGDYIEVAYSDRPFDYVDVINIAAQVEGSGLTLTELLHSEQGGQIFAEAVREHYLEYGEYLLAARE